MSHVTNRLALTISDRSDLMSDFPVVDAANKAILDNGVTVSQGALASIPAASLAGRRYYATDVGVELFDTGAAWLPVGTSIPIGSVVQYSTSADPVDPDGTTRWMVCNGRVLSRTTYSLLFSLVGSTFGSGDGSTTFGIPNTTNLVVVGAGQGSGLTSRNLAATGGEDTHALSGAEAPSHSHSATVSGNTGTQSGNHTHRTSSGNNFGVFANFVTNFGFISSAGGVDGGIVLTQPASSGHTHSYSSSFTTSSTTGGAGHNNDQPYLTSYHIIRVL